jgi:hypothetical protein
MLRSSSISGDARRRDRLVMWATKKTALGFLFAIGLAGQSVASDPLEEEMRGMQAPKPTYASPRSRPGTAATQPNTVGRDYATELEREAGDHGDVDAETAAETADALDDPDRGGPDSLNLRFWNEARNLANQIATAIRDFPFRNPFWAPAIVGDYTEKLFDYVDKELYPSSQPSPDPSQQ